MMMTMICNYYRYSEFSMIRKKHRNSKKIISIQYYKNLKKIKIKTRTKKKNETYKNEFSRYHRDRPVGSDVTHLIRT